jgi:hypothetical protein
MFVPVEEKLKKFVPELKDEDEFNHYKSIIRDMIANGHAAHQSIPGYETCKPEIEAFRWFDGINIPVHGYCDLKGDKLIIEDKCKFPRKGIVKKDGTRSWLTYSKCQFIFVILMKNLTKYFMQVIVKNLNQKILKKEYLR